MAIARTRVIDECTVDENDYVQFSEDLQLYASKWVPSIQLGIARAARELFENAAVRMLVGEWADMERKDRAAAARAFERAGKYEDVDAEDFRGIGTCEKSGFDSALYMLLIK